MGYVMSHDIKNFLTETFWKNPLGKILKLY